MLGHSLARPSLAKSQSPKVQVWAKLQVWQDFSQVWVKHYHFYVGTTRGFQETQTLIQKRKLFPDLLMADPGHFGLPRRTLLRGPELYIFST